jgi:2,4-dienoyl-CoA reductase (NADPH2)
MEFIKLFEPIVINGVNIANRIVMPAMGLSYTHDYSFNDRYKAFYRERAKGGVGLMTIGPLAIDRVGSAPFMPSIMNDEDVNPLRSFNRDLHTETGVKLSTQLFHMGRYAYSMLTKETPVAPSAIPSKLTRETPREMTKEDIETVKNAFAQAARRAREAEFDTVEIIACTGYLISQFLSPLTNIREDEYGGSQENRMRFGLEVIERVRETLGPDFPVGVRIAGHDFMEGGNTDQEAVRFAAAAEKAGADFINVTGGWHETNVPQLTTNVPAGGFVHLARGVKQAVNVPVFASNRLGDPVVAEKALRSGACDMVCWGRPLIADPELPNKVKQKRFDEITYCISCNQGCFDSIFNLTSVHCALNPRAGREDQFSMEKSDNPLRIMVAGGGPAGMEFALTAAQRGHNVTLYERENILGGQVNLAMAPPGKGELQRIISSLEKRMALNGVKVELGVEVTGDLVDREKPDLLVVASGAKPMEIDVPGKDSPHVVNAWDVLMDRVPDIGHDVVIVGGSATGCETAHHISSMNAPDADTFRFLMYHNAQDPAQAMQLLHSAGRNITIIEMVGRLATNVGKTSRWSLMKSLRLEGVNLRPNTTLLEIHDNKVTVKTGDKVEEIPADTVIMAVGAVPRNRLATEAQGKGIKVVTIGDALRPRRITEAVLEGFQEALKV